MSSHLPRNPTWSFEFRKEIQAFSGTNRCIAPDLIGFVLSDKPEDWTFLPEDHAKNLGQFLTSLHLENITLVVGDNGGDPDPRTCIPPTTHHCLRLMPGEAINLLK